MNLPKDILSVWICSRMGGILNYWVGKDSGKFQTIKERAEEEVSVTAFVLLGFTLLHIKVV